MNILVLNFEYPPLGGGASPVCHEINRRYVAHGHRVVVVTMGFDGLPMSETADGVEVYRVPCMRTRKHICSPPEQLTYLFSARKFLNRWLKTNPVDIVHAHFVLPTGILCQYLKRKFGLPYIITAHGSDIPGFNPDRFRFLHHFTPPLIRRISSASSGITSPSVYLKELMTPVMRESGSKIIVVPNGIDAGKFQPAQKEKWIVSSGRLLRRKGFFELIEAVRDLSPAYTLHILGDGPLRGELEKLASHSKMPVVFHGWLDNRSPAYLRWLSGAAIYCLVSSHENASISMLEAMASGCAVITSTQTGCPEMVSDAGLRVPFGNVAQLKNAIEELIRHPDNLHQLGDKAMQRAREMYDWDKIVHTYLHLLNTSAVQHQA